MHENNKPLVIKMRCGRNQTKLAQLLWTMDCCVGQIAGTWYLCHGIRTNYKGVTTVVFYLQPDKDCLHVYDRCKGDFVPYPVYRVADFKSSIWAIRRFCCR